MKWKFSGTEVKWWREAEGMSQVALSRAIECARSCITTIERGQTKPPVNMVCKLAEALNCRPGDFFKEDV